MIGYNNMFYCLFQTLLDFGKIIPPNLLTHTETMVWSICISLTIYTVCSSYLFNFLYVFVVIDLCVFVYYYHYKHKQSLSSIPQIQSQVPTQLQFQTQSQVPTQLQPQLQPQLQFQSQSYIHPSLQQQISPPQYYVSNNHYIVKPQVQVNYPQTISQKYSNYSIPIQPLLSAFQKNHQHSFNHFEKFLKHYKINHVTRVQPNLKKYMIQTIQNLTS